MKSRGTRVDADNPGLVVNPVYNPTQVYSVPLVSEERFRLLIPDSFF